MAADNKHSGSTNGKGGGGGGGGFGPSTVAATAARSSSPFFSTPAELEFVDPVDKPGPSFPGQTLPLPSSLLMGGGGSGAQQRIRKTRPAPAIQNLSTVNTPVIQNLAKTRQHFAAVRAGAIGGSGGTGLMYSIGSRDSYAILKGEAVFRYDAVEENPTLRRVVPATGPQSNCIASSFNALPLHQVPRFAGVARSDYTGDETPAYSATKPLLAVQTGGVVALPCLSARTGYPIEWNWPREVKASSGEATPAVLISDCPPGKLIAHFREATPGFAGEASIEGAVTAIAQGKELAPENSWEYEWVKMVKLLYRLDDELETAVGPLTSASNPFKILVAIETVLDSMYAKRPTPAALVALVNKNLSSFTGNEVAAYRKYGTALLTKVIVMAHEYKHSRIVGQAMSDCVGDYADVLLCPAAAKFNS